MQRHEERFLPEEFLTQMEQQRQETIGAMGMSAGGRMAPPFADRHMERLDRHIAREERRAKKKRSRQHFEEIQRRVAEQEAAIEAERIQAEYDRVGLFHIFLVLFSDVLHLHRMSSVSFVALK